MDNSRHRAADGTRGREIHRRAFFFHVPCRRHGSQPGRQYHRSGALYHSELGQARLPHTTPAQALDNEADDIIDDSHLYFMFVRLAAQARTWDDPSDAEKIIAQTLTDYVEPVPGARDRIAKALRVMLIGWLAARMKQAAESLLDECEKA